MKKAKKSAKESAAAAAAPWPWQGLVENLQLAQQELLVIIDVIKDVSSFGSLFFVGKNSSFCGIGMARF